MRLIQFFSNRKYYDHFFGENRCVSKIVQTNKKNIFIIKKSLVPCINFTIEIFIIYNNISHWTK